MRISRMPSIPKSMEDDFCTLVSIVPFHIQEYKPGIYPGNFVMPPCRNPDVPELLLVGPSVFFIPQFNGNEEMPPLEMFTSSREIASAVVHDYIHSQFGITGPLCQPGFTYFPGKVTIVDIMTNHKDKIKELKMAQLTWFKEIVKQADNDWNRHHRHSVISMPQIFAAKALEMKRDWMLPEATEVPIKCPACLSNCDPKAIICSNCKCILDKDRYKEMTFAA